MRTTYCGLVSEALIEKHQVLPLHLRGNQLESRRLGALHVDLYRRSHPAPATEHGHRAADVGQPDQCDGQSA